jgi:hypothetical protein
MQFLIVYYFALFSSFLPLVFSIYQLKKIDYSLTENRIVVLLICSKFLFDFFVFVFEQIFSNSLPIFHLSVLIEFVLIIFILKRIHHFSFFKWFLFIGVFVSLLDATYISNIYSSNIFSSVINFGLLIFYCGKILSIQNISKKDELFNATIFLYYIVALTYTVFQKFHVHKTTLNDLSFYFFAFATIGYNISLSKIVCILKKK